MNRPRERDVCGFGSAISIAVLFFAVCVAALFAHLAIDAAGDVLLPHDTYDDLPHDSRGFTFVGAAALALVALFATVRLAFVEARGSAGAVRATLLRSLPMRGRAFAFAVGGGTLPAVAAMGAFDDALAARPFVSIAALFGGSCGLGLALAALCAVGVAALCSLAVRGLARVHRSLVGAARAFVSTREPGPTARYVARVDSVGSAPVAATLARRAAGRAPPLLFA